MNFRPRRSAGSSDVYLNMTPLVDVVLLLLLFFMVTTQFGVLPGLKMLLPAVDAESRIRVRASERLELSVTAAGDIFLENQPVALSALPALLNRTGAAGDEVVVVVSADRDLPYGRVVKIMDALRLAGFHRVVLAGRTGSDAEKEAERD